MTVPILKTTRVTLSIPRATRGTIPIPKATSVTPASRPRHLLHVEDFILHLLEGAEGLALPQPRLLQLRLQVGDKLLAEAWVPLPPSPRRHPQGTAPVPPLPMAVAPTTCTRIRAAAGRKLKGGCVGEMGMPGDIWGHLGTSGDTNLLVLQLADGGLGALQVLGGRGAALLHHRQLPLDDVVLLRLLRPCHLALGTAGTCHHHGMACLVLPPTPPQHVTGRGPEVVVGWWGQGGDAGDVG